MNTEEIVSKVLERVLEKLSEKEKTFTPSFLLIDNIDEIALNSLFTVNMKDYEQSRGLIFCNFDWINLFRLKNLTSITDSECLFVESLLEGKETYIIFPNNEPVNKLLQSRVKQTINDLSQLGVVFLKRDEVEHYFDNFSRTQQKNVDNSQYSSKELITLDTLKKNYNVNDLSFFKKEPNMIITALAEDYLRENNIYIN